jgi:hypothetical protein
VVPVRPVLFGDYSTECSYKHTTGSTARTAAASPTGQVMGRDGVETGRASEFADTLSLAGDEFGDEALLWVASMGVLEQEVPQLAAEATRTLQQLFHLQTGDRSQGADNGANASSTSAYLQGASLLVSPAWPCTEAVAMSPYCVCLACFC